MAQLIAIQLPPSTLQGLGAATPSEHTWRAAAVLGGGLLTALGLVLFANGRYKEAYAIAVATAITGAFVGAAGTLDGRV